MMQVEKGVGEEQIIRHRATAMFTEPLQARIVDRRRTAAGLGVQGKQIADHPAEGLPHIVERLLFNNHPDAIQHMFCLRCCLVRHISPVGASTDRPRDLLTHPRRIFGA